MRPTLNRCGHIVALTATVLLTACGSPAKSGGGGGPKMGKVESAFVAAAKATGVPVRYMIATGYLESHLAPQNATAKYVSINAGDDQAVPRGTLMTETAFGLTYDTLGLDKTKEDSSALETQINAYAQWLKGQLATAGVKLSANPQTPEDKFYWIQTLANLHREGLNQRQNVRILFARELIGILNEGFVWQDPRNGERLTLEKEAQPISVAAFPANGQQWFLSLDEMDTQISYVSYVPLVTVPSDGLVNHPKRIEVIHCPLTLSACLELQTRSKESDIHLAAHYIIPDDLSIIRGTDLREVLQVADTTAVLTLTDDKGQDQLVGDAVIIMLAGNSGRLVDGTRMPAIPTWFNDHQLHNLGQLVNDLCTIMAQKTPTEVNRDQCMTVTGDLGVNFHHQDKSEEYRWGDIADFDSTIFEAYVKNLGGISPSVKFDFPGNKREFKAGDNVPLKLLFGPQVHTVELERLNRCPDGRIVWEPVRNLEVRGETSTVFSDINYFDSGPNRGGDQFFRARVYGKDGLISGWSIDQIILSGFEPDQEFASEKNCSADN